MTPTTKTYEPEQETDYAVNHWCWFRSSHSDSCCVPPELFAKLTAGTFHTTHRRYLTAEEAMADLEQAMG